ncbi:MAG: NAD(+) kinase [Candidatus Zixiibacteriota bacterium]|nr:MAG: NAD(+) kinase [candidate division Zixibacteria bacterium]
MHFGLIANLKRVGADETINAFVDWANKNGTELTFCDDLKDSIAAHKRFLPRHELPQNVDIIVAMGGDGTILAAARSVGSVGTPILGINLGSLGFLTQQTPSQLIPALDAIIAREYRIDERMLLKAEIAGQGPLPMPYALNDIVLDNGPVSRVLDINLRINGEDVVTYIADGLIIATPTGSTAYNLAVGGPIVSPNMDAMIAAPIAPFSLTTRPMIIPGDAMLELTVFTDEHKAMLTLDGQVGVELLDSQKVTISRAEFKSKFILFPENSYYKLLRSKLHWGVRPNP